jgi:hypothetical protein
MQSRRKRQQDLGRIVGRRLVKRGRERPRYGRSALAEPARLTRNTYTGSLRALNSVPCGDPGIQSSMQGPNLFETVIHQNLGDARR